MKRGMPLFALFASRLLHAGVVAALILYPVSEVKIETPPVVQLVKLAPPPPPEPIAQPEPVKPPPPPPKPVSQPRPKPKPVAKPEPKPQPAPVPKPEPVAEPQPPEPEAARPESVTETAKAPEPKPAQPAPSAPVKPVYKPVNVQAAYLSNPKPDYPRIARRRGWEGVVVLQIDLDRNGEPQRVEIADSSGHRILDKAAQAAVRRWRFNPATRDGKTIAARNVRVPIQFRLDDA